MCRLHDRRHDAFRPDPSKHASAGIQPCARAQPDHLLATSAPDAMLPTGAKPVNLDPADFSADITHPYWPMKPGTRWTYRDVDEKGEVQDVVIVSTTETKKLANGITARVVRDTVGAKANWSRTPSTGTRKIQRAMSGTWARTLPSSRTARSLAEQVPSRLALEAHCPASSCRPTRKSARSTVRNT